MPQYVSVKYGERLAEAGIEPSVGSVGDSYDNALAETVMGLVKTEVIQPTGPRQLGPSFRSRRPLRHAGMGGLIQQPLTSACAAVAWGLRRSVYIRADGCNLLAARPIESAQ
jgi:transposase InsO family protein